MKCIVLEGKSEAQHNNVTSERAIKSALAALAKSKQAIKNSEKTATCPEFLKRRRKLAGRNELKE